MMIQNINREDISLWREYVEAHASSIRSRQELFASSKACLGALASRGDRIPGEAMASSEVAALVESAGLPADSRSPTKSDLEAWARFVEARAGRARSLDQLLSRCTDRVAVARLGLESTGEGRVAGLDLASVLEEGERERLADNLLALASYSHGLTERARRIILTLPHPWLLANIEKLAGPILRHGTDEEYRAIFEVYRAISPELAIRLTDEASAHPDEEIREAGIDLRKALLQPQ